MPIWASSYCATRDQELTRYVVELSAVEPVGVASLLGHTDMLIGAGGLMDQTMFQAHVVRYAWDVCGRIARLLSTLSTLAVHHLR